MGANGQIDESPYNTPSPILEKGERSPKFPAAASGRFPFSVAAY